MTIIGLPCTGLSRYRRERTAQAGAYLCRVGQPEVAPAGGAAVEDQLGAAGQRRTQGVQEQAKLGEGGRGGMGASLGEKSRSIARPAVKEAVPLRARGRARP